ncbi:DUF7507 domain-containing protein [Pseudoalteromonas sp. T1lg88]|uniref:DUF7507 domain-containing protein n=1 Tax=Pseudoalteromonas sp. T1lg88 TaxID=2077104 RepID=UPI000CF6E8C4|nr:hypothetical protein [Pseudoalteromonas sp. T1lg88]
MKTKMNSWWGTSGFSCSTLTNSKLLALFLVLGFTLCAQNAFAEDPGAPSDNGVQPEYVEGNPTCFELTGVEGLLEYRINDPGDGMWSNGEINVDIDIQPDKTFDWTVSGGVIIQSIFVKGGPAGNLYEYYADSGEITLSDGGLHSPVNHKNGNYYGLSHISFCYTPGAPDIKLTKDCTFDSVVDGEALKYNYVLTVENTGTLPLFDITVVDTTAEGVDGAGSHTYNHDGLEPGATKQFNGSFVIGQNGILNHATVTAAIEDNGPVEVDDMASWDCPSQEIPGSLSLEKDCNVVVVLNDNLDYGLQVNYSGEVCNTSAVTMLDVEVEDVVGGNIIATHDIGTLTPAGTMGACAEFQGSYVPVPGDGELGDEGQAGFYVRAFSDTVEASGVTFFGLPVDAMPADAECTLCPQCVDMEMCPAPASAINLE